MAAPVSRCAGTGTCEEPVVLVVARFGVATGRCDRHSKTIRRVARENRDGTWTVLMDGGAVVDPIPTPNQTIGANVRRLRESAPYSQQELALRLRPWGISWEQSTVSRVESGMRELTFSEAWAVVTVCGGSFEDLCWIPDTVSA